MKDIQWLNEVATNLYQNYFAKEFGDRKIKVYRSMMPSNIAGYALRDEEEHYIMIAFNVTETGEIVSIIAHELVHIAIGVHHGHNAKFNKYAKKIGLTKPFTEIPKKTPETLDYLVDEVIQYFGEYPVESTYLLKYNAEFSSGGKAQLKCRNCGLSVHVANRSLLSVQDKKCTNCSEGVFH